MTCLWCGSSKIRLSCLRTSDLKQLLAGKLPVRCRLCHERYYVSLRVAFDLRKPVIRPAPMTPRHKNHAIKQSFIPPVLAMPGNTRCASRRRAGSSPES